jgi:hypothetical protein
MVYGHPMEFDTSTTHCNLHGKVPMKVLVAFFFSFFFFGLMNFNYQQNKEYYLLQKDVGTP